jgi:hypothetical protein
MVNAPDFIPDAQFTPDSTPQNGSDASSPDFIADKDFQSDEDKYGGLGQSAAAFAEGVGQGAIPGAVTTAAEAASGVPSQDIRGRESAHPYLNAIGQATGLVGSTLIPGIGQAGLLERAGAAAAEGVVSKIGSAAVKGAIETAILGGNDELAKMIMQDPGQTQGTAAASIGLSGMIGLVAGPAGYGASQLWKSTVGPKASQFLQAITNHMGGIDGETAAKVAESPAVQAINKLGVDIDPEVKAALSDIPEANMAGSTLNQSDETASGLSYQKSMKEFRSNMNDSVIGSLGKTPEQVAALPDELSKYDYGKRIGNTLADEYQKQIDPISEEFEDKKAKYGSLELQPDQKIEVRGPNPYQLQGTFETLPGTTSKIAQDIGDLAIKQGWTQSADSDIMREVNRVMKEVGGLKTVKDLGSYITRIGENTASTLPFGAQTPLSRAGSLMKNVLKEAESNTVLNAVGQKEGGVAAVAKFSAARDAYRAQSVLKDAIDDSLHAGGSTSGFSKSVRAMAQTDGEAVLNRLSGKGNAALLQTLQDKFPQTADLVRQWHIDNALNTASKAAKGEDTISASKLLSHVSGMEPELRNFVLSGDAQAKINAVGTVMDKIESMPYNFSNTARTAERLMGHIPGSAIGSAAMLLGHGSERFLGLLAAPLTKYFGKTLPDAQKLTMLRLLGSGKSVESGAFKSMLNYMQAVVKGDSDITKGVKNVFKVGGAAVAQQVSSTSTASTAALDKSLKSMMVAGNPTNDMDGDLGHYIPEHATAVASATTAAVQYVNSQRPSEAKQSPLDTKPTLTFAQKAAWRRTLTIADEPLIVLNSLKEGRLTPKDVVDLRNTHPGTYAAISSKLTNEVMDMASKGKDVPYKVRLGLSMFLGQNLDSTMAPQSIIAAQPQPTTPPMPTSGTQKPKKGTATLSKLPGQYMTKNQAREAPSEKS